MTLFVGHTLTASSLNSQLLVLFIILENYRWVFLVKKGKQREKIKKGFMLMLQIIVFQNYFVNALNNFQRWPNFKYE